MKHQENTSMCEKQPCVERSHGALSVLIIANNNYCNRTTLGFCHDEGDYLRQSIADFHPDVPARVLKDADHHEMQTAIEEFTSSASQSPERLLFFAGHGVETGQGTFMLPTDSPGEHELLDLTRCISVEGLKLQFRGQNGKGTLAIVLACCRRAVQAAPVHLPFNLRYQRPKSAVVVLHGCEQGDVVGDGSETVFTPAGQAYPVSNLGLACARAFAILRHSLHEDVGGLRLADVLFYAKSIACTMNWRPGQVRRRPFPTWEELRVPRITKRDGCGLVPSTDLRPSAADMLSTWKSCRFLAVDLQFREALVVMWQNTHNNEKVVSPMRDILGDLVRVPGCCSQIMDLWHTRKVLSPAVEVFACAQMMYRLPALGCPQAAEKYMQRALGLFLSTDFDEFVQATFFACFGRFLQFRKGHANQEAKWKNDAWEFLLYTSELHMQCGMTEISLYNLLSACKLRLQIARGSPGSQSSATTVQKLLRDIDSESLRHLPAGRLAQRTVLIDQARQLQGM